jgi:hypothetical protein
VTTRSRVVQAIVFAAFIALLTSIVRCGTSASPGSGVSGGHLPPGMQLTGPGIPRSSAGAALRPADRERFDAAMDRLSRFEGNYSGEGVVSSGQPSAPLFQVASVWSIARTHEGGHVRIEYTLLHSRGNRTHWAGFLSYDVASAQYVLVWTSMSGGDTLHEFGHLDPDDRVLTLRSSGLRGPACSTISVTDDGLTVFDMPDGPFTTGATPPTLHLMLRREP